MVDDETARGEVAPLPVTSSTDVARSALVVRSDVRPVEHYDDYRQVLRFDFFYSCAYCTMSESEARGIRFTIDHYEPQSSRRDLVNEYSNLLYACDTCNTRKGRRCPSPEARTNGQRFFRPDHDVREDHFERSGIRISPLTKVGSFSIDALDLNRKALTRLRELRARLKACDALVVSGVHALRSLPIDQIPPEIRGQAVKAIRSAINVAESMPHEIDDMLRDFARSELLDPDEEAQQRKRERLARLKQMEAIHPETWRSAKSPPPQFRRRRKRK